MKRIIGLLLTLVLTIGAMSQVTMDGIGFIMRDANNHSVTYNDLAVGINPNDFS
jgi:hypothetical protein